METGRGRWFLAEYARRNRHADTEMLLSAIERLEHSVHAESIASAAQVRSGLIEMLEAIARAKADIAALKPEGAPGRIEEATEELDAIVSATETATSGILAAAEEVQEIAWALRENGTDAQHCDVLDACATEIYTACSFQDLTGQRTQRVIHVLRYLETRIGAMIAWCDDDRAPALAPAAAEADERALLNGPSKPGQGLAQAEVDQVMEPEAASPQADENPLASLLALSDAQKLQVFS